MPAYANRVLTAKYGGASTFAGTLATEADPDLTQTPNVPGETMYVTDGTYTLGFRYVKLDTVANLGALVAGAPMYFVDYAQRTANSNPLLAASYVAAADSAMDSIAGVCLNASAGLGGNGVWLQTRGFLAGITTPSAPTKGQRLVPSNAAGTVPTINAYAAVAPGTAPATPEAMSMLYITVLTSTGATTCSGWIQGLCNTP